MAEGEAKPFTSGDLRFTKKADALYVIFLDWPQSTARIEALGSTALANAAIERVDLLGGPELRTRQTDSHLEVELPAPRDGQFVPVIRLRGRGLV
jgi:alpha-L-fucosidase